MNNADVRLPIKVVFPQAKDFVAREVKPRQWPPFPGFTPEKRSGLADQAQNVAVHFKDVFPQWESVPAVAKVTLIPAAVAKTYRPWAIFNGQTCPIIGTGHLGELYVSVTPSGISKLVDKIRNGMANQTIAHLSTIQKIEPYAADAPSNLEIAPSRQSKQRQGGSRLRCRLFRHPGSQAAASEQEFVQFAKNKGARVEPMAYSDGLRILCLHNLAPEHIPVVRAHPAVEDLSPFPEYHAVRSICHPKGMVTADVFPPPVEGVEYGVVGLIDSGTDRNNPYLQAWVLDRYEEFVRPEMQDNTHGSFVAGMLIHARLLNANHDSFPSTSSFVIDVVALDRDGKIDEYDLLTIIDKSIAKYPHVRVWNLSLGRDTPCEDGVFSPLAVALDQRMKEHDIVFVCAAGNYNQPPYRAWPLDGSIVGDDDRICPPADAQRGVTVGALAHLDNANTRVSKGSPSPFTRRGPAPAFGIKPEISFPGGNCDKDGRHAQTGIISIDGSGHTAESIGTSYPTPLASTLLANLVGELSADGEVAPIPLAKSLLFHSAFLRDGVPEIQRFRHVGIGTPYDLPDILHCRQDAATIILQVPLTPKPDFVKSPFPIPPCLIHPDKGLRCDLSMTL